MEPLVPGTKTFPTQMFYSPCTSAQSALSFSECKVDHLEYLKSFGCSCTLHLPSAMLHHHLVTNPQIRSLLFWFDLLLQLHHSLPKGLPPPHPETPWHVHGTWPTSPWPLAWRATTLLLKAVLKDWPAMSQWLRRGSWLPQSQCWPSPAPWHTKSAPCFKHVLTGLGITEHYAHKHGSEALSTAETCFRLNGKVNLRINAGTPSLMADNCWNKAVVIWYLFSLSLDFNRIYLQKQRSHQHTEELATFTEWKEDWMSSAKIHNI